MNTKVNQEKNNTLLYLEDDEALAYVTKRSLEKRGFQVHHALTLGSLRQSIQNVTFTYALLDLKIGRDTSMELITEIKKTKDVPIVILTGYGTVRSAVQAMKLGAINFLSKPCTIDEIIKALLEVETNNETTVKNTSANETLEKPSLKAIEHETIQRVLDENEGNISAAARQLKMHRRTLQRKLQKRHIDT